MIEHVLTEFLLKIIKFNFYKIEEVEDKVIFTYSLFYKILSIICSMAFISLSLFLFFDYQNAKVVGSDSEIIATKVLMFIIAFVVFVLGIFIVIEPLFSRIVIYQDRINQFLFGKITEIRYSDIEDVYKKNNTLFLKSGSDKIKISITRNNKEFIGYILSKAIKIIEKNEQQNG